MKIARYGKIPVVLTVLAIFIAGHFFLSAHYLGVIYHGDFGTGQSWITYPNAPAGTQAATIASFLAFPFHEMLMNHYMDRQTHLINAGAFWLIPYCLIVFLKESRGDNPGFGYFGVRTLIVVLTVFYFVVEGATRLGFHF